MPNTAAPAPSAATGISRDFHQARGCVASHQLLVFPITPSTSQSIVSSSGSVTLRVTPAAMRIWPVLSRMGPR